MVDRPSGRCGRGRETLREVRKWSEDHREVRKWSGDHREVQKWSGDPPGGAEVIG